MPATKKGKMVSARQAFARLRGQLRAAFVGRAEACDGVLLGALAGENVLLVGPPGTAKSCLGRLVLGAFPDAKRFTTQLHSMMPPEDLFGPFDLKRMKESGEWSRRYQNFLPAAEVVLIDEVFRGSGAILDTMLKCILEHKYEDDGGEIDVPIKILIGTSNSVPDDPNLAAFYDRWALRYHVKPPGTARDMEAIVRMEEEPSVSQRLTIEQLEEAQTEVLGIEVPEAVQDAVVRVWLELRSAGHDISARKVRKALVLIRAHAWLMGRDIAGVEDIDVMIDVAWDDPADYATIKRVVLQASCPSAAEATEALDLALSALGEIPGFDGTNTVAVAQRGSEANEKVSALIKDVEALRAKADASEHDRLDSILRDMAEIRTQVVRRMANLAVSMEA